MSHHVESGDSRRARGLPNTQLARALARCFGGALYNLLARRCTREEAALLTGLLGLLVLVVGYAFGEDGAYE